MALASALEAARLRGLADAAVEYSTTKDKSRKDAACAEESAVAAPLTAPAPLAVTCVLPPWKQCEHVDALVRVNVMHVLAPLVSRWMLSYTNIGSGACSQTDVSSVMFRVLTWVERVLYDTSVSKEDYCDANTLYVRVVGTLSALQQNVTSYLDEVTNNATSARMGVANA